MKTGLKNSLLVLASICAGLLIAEIMVRSFYPASLATIKLNKHAESERRKFSRYDPMLGWTGLAYVEDDFEWTDVHHMVTHNAFGFRGEEYLYERSDKHRIAILGDSFVWGFGVSNEHIFTNLMEQYSKQPIEVINFGVPGYGTDQEYLLWRKKGWRWRPDEVYLMITI